MNAQESRNMEESMNGSQKTWKIDERGVRKHGRSVNGSQETWKIGERE